MARIGILICQHIQITRLYEDADGVYHCCFARCEATEIALVKDYIGGDVLSCDHRRAVLGYELHVVIDGDDGLEISIGDGVEVGTPLRIIGRSDDGSLRGIVVRLAVVALVGDGRIDERRTIDVIPFYGRGSPTIGAVVPCVRACDGARCGESAREQDAMYAEMSDGVHLGFESEGQTVAGKGLVELQVDDAVCILRADSFLVDGLSADDGGCLRVEDDGRRGVLHGEREGDCEGAVKGGGQRRFCRIRHVCKEVERGCVGIISPSLWRLRRPALRGSVVCGCFVKEDGGGVIEVLIAEDAHRGRMALRIVCFVGIGAGENLLRLYGEGDVVVAVGMLNGHVGSVASTEDCERDHRCYGSEMLHVCYHIYVSTSRACRCLRS